MKVLHTVINGEVAGGQIVCLSIVEALLKAGHQAVVVSPTGGPFTESLKKKGVPVFLIRFEKTYSFHRAFQLASLARKQRVGLIHSHGMVPHNVHSRLAARLAGIPCVSHIHIENFFSPNPWIRRYQVCLDNWTSRFCSQLIAVSQSTADSLVRQGISRDRIEVIPNGVRLDLLKDPETPQRLRAEWGLAPGARLVGTIGRLCPVKGQREFLMAAQEAEKEIPDVSWVIVGKDMEFGGDYEKKLRDLANKAGFKREVRFTGHLEDPYPLLSMLEFFVLPSKMEGLPLVILEAMALGKAVIASEVGGVPEVVEDGKTGILVPPGDARALARAMIDLLRYPDKAIRMGQAGLERVRRHFLESDNLSRIMTLYRRLVRETGD